MGYMSGREVNLVRNVAGVTCTNSVHSVRVRDHSVAAKLLPSWGTPFVRLSCELEGHALGGGMLKLEPREAARILFPDPSVIKTASDDMLAEAITTMQSWRHYAA
jgi:adenine-specific DNA-methyltransferase